MPGSPRHRRRVPITTGSVLDLPALERALGEHGIEVCVHLAGQSMIEGAAAGPLAALDVNIRGTWTVLEACRRARDIRSAPDLPSVSILR
jgi:CDP-glucose 4,6-dehydratase